MADLCDTPAGLNDIVEAVPEAAVALSPTGTILGANSRASPLLEAALAIGETRFGDLFPDDAERVKGALKMWRGVGSPAPARLTLRARPDANPRPLFCEGWRWRRATGDLLMVRLLDRHEGVAKLTELSALVDRLNVECNRRAKVEGELRSLLTKLHAQNAARDNMLAQMSHDLRTPLNAILGMSEFMLTEPYGQLPSSYQSYVHDIHNSGRTLLQLIEHVLAMSVGGEEETAAQIKIFDLRDCVEACLDIVRPLAQLRGATLLIPSAMSLPRLRGDQILMKQVLLNLLSNAVKHGGQGCRIELRSVALGNGDMRLEVVDDGPGITGDKMPTLFERAPTTPYIVSPSGGVGLFLTKRSADALGLRLSISSASGRGTVARLDFPADLLT